MNEAEEGGGLGGEERRSRVRSKTTRERGNGRMEEWGEIRGHVVCDVCGDAAIGPEDHVLEGAEVAVLCITRSGEVINYQAFTNSKGVYIVGETMPESDRWESCLARPISSFHQHCTKRGDTHSGVKFTYSKPSGNSHTVKTFLYKPANAPLYCS